MTVQQFPRASGPPPGRGGMWESLRIPQFRWLYLSNTTFFLAMQGQLVVRSWLVFSLTGSEFALGLVSLMVALSMLSLGPVGGVAADRFERRGLVAAGQATVVVAEVVVLSLLLSGNLDYWHILVQVTVVGAVFPFVMPARNAIVADVVGRRRLTNAMALSMDRGQRDQGRRAGGGRFPDLGRGRSTSRTRSTPASMRWPSRA